MLRESICNSASLASRAGKSISLSVWAKGDELSSYSRTSGKNESSGHLDACKQDTERQGQKDARPGEVPDVKKKIRRLRGAYPKNP